MRKTAKIYYTSDVHGYLFPSAYTERSEKPAGLLNCIANYQKDGNTLVLDGGDTLQGSPMAIYLSAGRKEGLEAEHAIADVFNAGGYDAVTLGNHDFNFGYEYLEHHLNALNARCICANVRDRKGRLGVISSQVFTMENGLRLGVTGVVTDFVNVWEQPEHMRDLEVTEAFSAAERELECLKAISDVTVCIYHGGYECDLETGDLLSESGENVGCRILRELDFDVLLTAHQHMLVPVRKISGTTTLQLPANAVCYAKLEIACEDGEVSVSASIDPAGEIHDEEPYRSLLPLERRVQQWLDEKAGSLEEDIPRQSKLAMALQGSRVADFFNQLQLEYSGADLSCVGLGNTPMGLAKRVTTRDIVSVYPFANTLVVLEVDETVMKKALERCAEYFTVENGEVRVSDVFLKPKVEHYNYDFFAGISCEFDLRRPVGDRVTKLLYDGAPIGGRKLTLCMSDYRASGTGGYDFYRKCRVVKRIGSEVPQMALRYLREHETVQIETRSDLSVVW